HRLHVHAGAGRDVTGHESGVKERADETGVDFLNTPGQRANRLCRELCLQLWMSRALIIEQLQVVVAAPWQRTERRGSFIAKEVVRARRTVEIRRNVGPPPVGFRPQVRDFRDSSRCAHEGRHVPGQRFGGNKVDHAMATVRPCMAGLATQQRAAECTAQEMTSLGSHCPSILLQEVARRTGEWTAAPDWRSVLLPISEEVLKSKLELARVTWGIPSAGDGSERRIVRGQCSRLSEVRCIGDIERFSAELEHV